MRPRRQYTILTELRLRDVLSCWPLYQRGDHVLIKPLSGDSLSVMYCGQFDGVPFGPAMQLAEEPPNLLEINIIDDVLFLIFIQVEPDKRGQGYGEQLYELVCEFARQAECREVRQTPSGGYEDQTREAYLLKRGWQPDGDEVFRKVSP